MVTHFFTTHSLGQTVKTIFLIIHEFILLFRSYFQVWQFYFLDGERESEVSSLCITKRTFNLTDFLDLILPGRCFYIRRIWVNCTPLSVIFRKNKRGNNYPICLLTYQKNAFCIENFQKIFRLRRNRGGGS